MKICSICKADKPLSEFHRWKLGKDGYRNQCKPCRKVLSAKRYVDKKPEINRKSKEYYEANKEPLGHARKKYRKDNIELLRAGRRRWYKNNKERKLKENRDWYKNNPDKARAIQRKKSRRRRAKIQLLQENFNNEDVVYGVFENKCFVCGSDGDLTIDHHRPLSKGFVLDCNNCVILCRVCNSRKGVKDPNKFYTVGQLRTLATKFKKVSEIING